ncbi:hypothetical protein BDV18DRAFT_145377 [Aspergillus unguis]
MPDASLNPRPRLLAVLVPLHAEGVRVTQATTGSLLGNGYHSWFLSLHLVRISTKASAWRALQTTWSPLVVVIS